MGQRRTEVAHWTGSTWGIQTLDSEGDVGLFSSLAVDADDHVHVSYYDWTNRDLKYARQLFPLVLDKKATPRDGLRISDTLTYTLTLYGPGVNARLWDPLPGNVDYVTGSLTLPAVYSPTVRAVVWQGTLPTDTVQVVRFQVTPAISASGTLSLSPVIVNTAWLTDTVYGRGVSVSAIVNGWHTYLPLWVRSDH